MTKDDLVKFKEDLLSDFKAVFTKEKAVEVNLGMATLKDGETQIEYMGETDGSRLLMYLWLTEKTEHRYQ